MMTTTPKYYSIKITEFLMKTVGFWYAETEKERFTLDVILTYMLFAISIALGIESLDFYYSWGNFYAITYTACAVMPLVIILIKVIIFMHRRKEMLMIIKYTQDNFWYREYDQFGRSVLDAIDKKGILLVCSFTFFVQGTVFTYMMAPIVENIGKNETDRILPFTLWLDIPTSKTPYFEIVFVIETLALIQSGLCFCCFDNFLTILCIHAAGQFKILQHRLKTIFESSATTNSMVAFKLSNKSDEVYNKFKRCVMVHCKLIEYVQNLERMFSYTTLCQLLISSVMLCVAGFQVCVGRGTLIRRSIFIAHTLACFFQIFSITLTINELILESNAVGDAIYKCNWESTYHERNKGLRQGILFMILRSKRPSYITAGGFFPVSLETFMGVLSTAASYFTLLRNIEINES